VDFVVVGFGLGALGVLLGVVMLGWLAPRSQRTAARVTSPDAAARGRALTAEHRGTGQAFVYAGGAMLLATVAGLVGSLDDRTGAFLVTTTATVSAVGILLGGYLQRVRNPMPPRRRTRSASAASAFSVTARRTIEMPSLFADEPPPVQDPAPAESGVEEPPSVDFAANESREAAIGDEEMTLSAPAVGGAFASEATDPGPLVDSPVVAETTDSGSRQPADRAADSGSDDANLMETGDHQAVGQAPPSTHSTESPSARPDDEDPSSGHS
jgi:hypothetical protein